MRLPEPYQERLLRDEPLARHTAARLGGPAEWLYIARESTDELAVVVATAWEQGVPVRILGGGANVLVSDKGVRGLVVINDVSQIFFDDEPDIFDLWATSGTGLTVLARKCQPRGLAGLEWAVSVPGTVGGAVVNNAGAHGGDMASVLLEATVLEAGYGAKTLAVEDLHYGYRTSSLKTPSLPTPSPHGEASQMPSEMTSERALVGQKFLVMMAHLGLRQDAPKAILERMEAHIAHRKATQPPGASLGSIFKNPPGDYAGRLIEAAGLKGYSIGGAQVSPKHANFFINRDNATSRDYHALIRHVRDKVYETSGVELEMEVELVGEW